MEDWEAIIGRVKEDMTREMSSRRYGHIVGAGQTASQLAKCHGLDPVKAMAAALLHDVAREWPAEKQRRRCEQAQITLEPWEWEQPELLHAYVGVHVAQEKYGVQDLDVLNAICCHTVGHPQMGSLEKIVYLADKMEPNRSYPGVEKIRDTAVKSLDKAMIVALEQSIYHVLRKGRMLHPLTIGARNQLLWNEKINRDSGGNRRIGTQ
ncbi:bis(5'-nucleosyl)-tetraphosphatase (symmetrical) YqeK [Heliobacterium chlorum]|uniref:bis(5'-nucleosyl)-tetraphosphatase (symmetrical) n=1 Tax=Heliobacterium chlorum TaxID=2698 RepID=A0ABR7T1N9_HELCL|nr:bis(5'-nucleosyl)-tetraphosphatase (symmetrical) YqeK [Heliobacterium chlorum]MBC9783880.1 bis(5'-nucleosyl)-tetraphosphatase (symmetrical) YqeK [Heliobacterium chlorum]